ncbi:hypothetical protein KGM_209727A, partial [Danaus plexippus plexippus]
MTSIHIHRVTVQGKFETNLSAKLVQVGRQVPTWPFFSFQPS